VGHDDGIPNGPNPTHYQRRIIKDRIQEAVADTRGPEPYRPQELKGSPPGGSHHPGDAHGPAYDEQLASGLSVHFMHVHPELLCSPHLLQLSNGH